MYSYKQRHAVWQKNILKSILLPFFILLIIAVTVLTNTSQTSAAVSETLNFQGRLRTSSGQLVPDGSYNIEFKIYDSAAAGASAAGVCSLNASTDDCWWIESRMLSVQNGYFSVYLGEVTPFGANVPWDQELWLTMNVNSDGEMSPRFKLTAVPYAFRAGALIDASGNARTADDFAQIAPSAVQSVSAAIAALRLNQTGTGALLQLQGDGSDVFIVDKSGATVLGAGITVGNSSSTAAGTIRWSGTDLEVYDGVSWLSLTSGGGGGGGSSNTSTTLTSSITNLAGTATGVNTGLLAFSSGTAVSNTAGSTTGFIAPADGSFRTCLVVGNANRTAGSATLRWRVNGVSTGSGACVINGTNVRTSSSSIDPGVVSFSAGDTINVAFDSSGLTPAGTTEYTVYWTVEYESTATSGYFQQGGNDFGALAVLGTTDNYGLQIMTNGVTAASITSAGSVSLVNDLTVGNTLTVTTGGAIISGNSTINGTLDGITGLTVVSGGVNATGGIDNNGGGITEAGSISGVDGSITALAGLTIQSSSGGDITLDSASGIFNFNGSTLRRTGTGTTIFDLNDTSDTTFSITNTNGVAVANLSVEGSVSGLSFAGDGSALTNLDADEILTGTLADGRLSTNVALLNGTQTFTGLNTFGSGLVVGNTASATSGAIRFTGSDFEGYDGAQWVSLTSGGGGGGGNVTTVVKLANEIVNNSITLQDDDELAFPIGANEVWSFRFVVQANSGTVPDLRFAVTAPSGAVCRVAFSDPEGATSNGQYGCGVTSQSIPGDGAVDLYEITGTVTNGVNAGDVTLQWAQFTLSATNTTVFAGSYVNAFPESVYIAPPSSVFVQGGNTFGATAVLGTGDDNGLQLATNGTARLSFANTGEATFSAGLTLSSTLDAAGLATFTGGVTLGDAAGDGLTIVSNSVTLTNGLNFDSNTFVIDSSNDFVGINVASPTNRLTINAASTVDVSAQALVSTDASSNKGLVIQGVGSQTANLFELQNSSGVLLAGFSANGGLVLGQTTITSSATVSRSVLLPDESGTICLSNSVSCGYLPFATGSFAVDASINNSIAINKTGASGDLLALQNNGGAVFTVSNTGALQIQHTGTAALDIRNVGGTSYFSIDTTTGAVIIGQSVADAIGVLFVLDTKNTVGDPAGVDGAMYYNSALQKNRCYEGGIWKDCNQTSTRSFIDSVSDPVVDANTTNYWDLAAENNNSHPNITLSAASGKAVLGIMTLEVTATSNADTEVSARIERGIGSVPTCGSGTQVGGNPGIFSTNTGAVKSSTVTFLDTPNTTSTVYYVLCSDSSTVGTGANVTRIRFTLQEVVNTN